MAQTAGRDSARSEAGKGSEVAQDVVDQTTGAVAEGIDATSEAVRAGTERMLDAARDLAEQAPIPMVRLVLDRTAPAMEEMVKAESDLATFWLEMTRDQAQHTIETMQRLATVRDWREALELQGDYMRESMARMAEGISRQLTLTRTLTHSMLDAGRGNLKDAA